MSIINRDPYIRVLPDAHLMELDVGGRPSLRACWPFFTDQQIMVARRRQQALAKQVRLDNAGDGAICGGLEPDRQVHSIKKLSVQPLDESIG